jgi:hypothetical protein
MPPVIRSAATAPHFRDQILCIPQNYSESEVIDQNLEIMICRKGSLKGAWATACAVAAERCAYSELGPLALT